MILCNKRVPASFQGKICYLRLRAHGSGSISDLFLFRSDLFSSRMDATDVNPMQGSAEVKRIFLRITGNDSI